MPQDYVYNANRDAASTVQYFVPDREKPDERVNLGDTVKLTKADFELWNEFFELIPADEADPEDVAPLQPVPGRGITVSEDASSIQADSKPEGRGSSAASNKP